MIKFEDLCVGCPQGCIHCGRKRVPVYYCDKCGEEICDDTVYTDENYDHLCEYCLKEEHEANV